MHGSGFGCLLANKVFRQSTRANNIQLFIRTDEAKNFDRPWIGALSDALRIIGKVLGVTVQRMTKESYEKDVRAEVLPGCHCLDLDEHKYLVTLCVKLMEVLGGL